MLRFTPTRVGTIILMANVGYIIMGFNKKKLLERKDPDEEQSHDDGHRDEG